MKLYDMPNGSTIRLLEDAKVAPYSTPLYRGDEMKLSDLDGMYATCFKDGERAYPAAWTEVEIIKL